MSAPAGENPRGSPRPAAGAVLERLFAEQWPRLVAALAREFRDLDLAEEAAQEALARALTQWSRRSIPDRPGAWLQTAARRIAIDSLRRDAGMRRRLPLLVEPEAERPGRSENELLDDQLALIFACCHRSLDDEAKVALTLREVCGLSSRQIARCFMVSEQAMLRRLSRAKGKVRLAGVPFDPPTTDSLAERLDVVLGVIYLIFTEGHSSGEGQTLVRGDLCDEARWLAGLVAGLLPDEPEARGLAALLAFSDARRPARVDADGEIVLLADQDRSLWNADLIREGERHLADALRRRRLGPYQLQASIAAVHARAESAASTDWGLIVALYDSLMAHAPTPVIALNRAVALAERDGPARGLAELDTLAAEPALADYRYYHSTRADLLRRADRRREASEAYRRALDLSVNATERAFLSRRLDELGLSPTRGR